MSADWRSKMSSSSRTTLARLGEDHPITVCIRIDLDTAPIQYTDQLSALRDRTQGEVYGGGQSTFIIMETLKTDLEEIASLDWVTGISGNEELHPPKAPSLTALTPIGHQDDILATMYAVEITFASPEDKQIAYEALDQEPSFDFETHATAGSDLSLSCELALGTIAALFNTCKLERVLLRSKT